MTHGTVPHTRPASAAPVPANNRFLVGIAVGALVSLGVVAIALGSGAIGRVTSVAVGPTESRAFAQPINGASRGNVRLQLDAGRLTVGALDTGDTSLARATYSGPSGSVPEPSYRVRDGVGELAYTIRADHVRLPFFRPGEEDPSLNVGLARRAPLALNVDAGAAHALLDLSQLQVSRLDLHAGVADTRVRLPEAAGQTSVFVIGGVADLTVEVPQGVAADIQVSGGLASRRIDERRFSPQGSGRYRSAEYDTAVNRVDLHLELGIASLTIR
jgi:hypothetical protein